ncbi:hypothetical protein QTO34_017146 [Cnephaeus nilssonii]|uniref:40S ribosomal protein SA n=1 Tax=Cnephaeus nilssonii TaxID=3371016 RepID=A0AA40LQX3_CNENI|nr:hypothetical protein QTO34_017146 [Eptesicus nilssonii]
MGVAWLVGVAWAWRSGRRRGRDSGWPGSRLGQRDLSSRCQLRRQLSVCAMAVLRNRRGLWSSELTSCRGPSKAGELGACLLRHQAFQKPPPHRRLLKGLVHQQTGYPAPPRSKAKAKSDGIYIINLKRTWEKLLLTAHAIVATENPNDVNVLSSRNTGQQAVLKFAATTEATPVAGHFTPGTIIDPIQAAFMEPRLLVVTDPRADHRPLTEVSYVNLPSTALCNTAFPLCCL